MSRGMTVKAVTRRPATGTLLRPVEAIAGAVAAARGARALHPRGRTFHATVRILGSGSGTALLERAAEHRALVRFSRGAGLPAGWPDVLGVALRICHAGGHDVHLDLLASTAAGRAPLARHVPMLRRRLATTYTTVAGYRTRDGRRYLAVLPDPAAEDIGTDLDTLTAAAVRGRARFLLAVGTATGRWRVFGHLTVGEPIPQEVDRGLAFDPVRHRVPELQTDGVLWRLRAAAYRGSRRRRGGRLATPAGE
jgi:hypothetical protein